MSSRSRRLRDTKVRRGGIERGRGGRKDRTGRRRARRKEGRRFLTRLEKPAVEGHARSNSEWGAR
jgi:hypothetical protein